MDYPIKTLNQLRPILQGFRKAAGLTQAMMASRLGVTQQTYAQLEANPAAVSVERLFRVLRALDVDLTLAYTAARPQKGGVPRKTAPPPPASMSVAAQKNKGAKAKTLPAAHAKRVTPGKTKSPPATSLRASSAPKRAETTRKSSNNNEPTVRRSARTTGGSNKKRENW